jgi:hypothetical protein
VRHIAQTIPDELHQRMQIAIAQIGSGLTQKEFITQAIREKVERHEADEGKLRRGR